MSIDVPDAELVRFGWPEPDWARGGDVSRQSCPATQPAYLLGVHTPRRSLIRFAGPGL